jgi:hypothetical protein
MTVILLYLVADFKLKNVSADLLSFMQVVLKHHLCAPTRPMKDQLANSVVAIRGNIIGSATHLATNNNTSKNTSPSTLIKFITQSVHLSM